MLPWKHAASVKINEERGMKISLTKEKNDRTNKRKHNTSNQSEWHKICRRRFLQFL